MRKFFSVALNAVPVIVMVGCIPFIANDLLLAGVYVLVSIVAFAFRRERGDLAVFIFGFFAMTVSEYFFVMTGVETFNRVSFLGVMPLWLPFLWAYGFVAMKRAVVILGIK